MNDRPIEQLPPIPTKRLTHGRETIYGLRRGSFIRRVNRARDGELSVATNSPAMPQLPDVNPQPRALSSVFGDSAHPLLQQGAEYKASD